MSNKEGFCDLCHQNKVHRRVAGVFSLFNLVLFGLPSLLFGISTWQCTHCRSRRVFLVWQRAKTKKISRSSFKRAAPKPPPNGGLKSQTSNGKSIRSQLYSQKYRDGVVKRIVSNITSIQEVKDSLELPEAEVIQWIRQSFQRKEDRVEMLRDALLVYQKAAPDFDVEQLMLEIEQLLAAKPTSNSHAQSVDAEPDRSPSVSSTFINLHGVGGVEPVQPHFDSTESFSDSLAANQG
jgi:hypothetical protein